MKKIVPNFVTYEKPPGFYSVKHNSENVYTTVDHEGTLKIEHDDINMRREPVFKQLGSSFSALGFDENSFLCTFLGFTPNSDCIPTNAIHADIPGVYTSDKILNLSTIDKIHYKYYVIDGSVVKRKPEPKRHSFVRVKLSAFKVFCEPETLHVKKINTSVLKSVTFCIEDNNHEEVFFNGKSLNFTMQFIKI